MKRPLLLNALLVFVARFAAAEDFGFSQGVRPLELGPAPSGVDSLSAAACGGCHRAAFEEWSKSRHAEAWTNAIFARGFRAEPVRRCVHCHAPLKTFADEGVSCAVCHVRGGEILAAHEAPSAPHPVRVVPELGESAFCANCHQFEFHELREGKLSLTGVPIQNTFGEWQKYRAAGGTSSCTDCHMARGTHAFRGGHDLELLTRALSVRVERMQDRLVFSVKSEGVGHAVPTGDVFRHFTLEVAPARDEHFETIARIGRRYEAVPDESGAHHMTSIEDTALEPGEVLRVEYPVSRARAWRLRYHYEREDGEVVTVKQGLVPKPDARVAGLSISEQAW